MICESVKQGAKTPGIWNPVAVLRHRQARTASTRECHCQPQNLLQGCEGRQAACGFWINPTGSVSEHPPGLITAGPDMT